MATTIIKDFLKECTEVVDEEELYQLYNEYIKLTNKTPNTQKQIKALYLERLEEII